MNFYHFLRSSVLVIVIGLLSAATAFAEEKSEAQKTWEKQVGPKALENPAFAYVEDDPSLPRVLLIGDSISIGYTPYVRDLLKGKANVHRIPVNGGDTNRGWGEINAWLGKEPWDVIHFNWGLHDLKRLKGGKLDVSAERALTPEAYGENLRRLVARLKKTGAKLIWCATTPVPEGSAGRIPGDDVTYNAIAADIMKELDVPVNDLYTYIKPDLATYQRPANVHFLPEGSAHLAKQVAEVIEQALAK